MRMSILIVIFALFAFLAQPAAAESYYIWDDYGGTWADAEKTASNTDDDLLCWASSASNILWYTGWGLVDSLSTTDDIFAYFQTHWSDDLGNPYYAWTWWFDGVNDMQGEAVWAQEDVDGGGNFYPALTAEDYIRYEGDDDETMGKIDAWLHDGYGSTLSIEGSMAHSITVWGYEYDQSGYKGVYVTDSDDDLGGDAPRPDTLRYYDVTLSGGKWWLSGGYYGDGDDNYISEVVSLQIMPGHEPVPEPTTIVLLSVGVAGLAFCRRKKKQAA